MAKTKLITIKGDTAADRILEAWKLHALDHLSDDDKQILDRITEVEKRFHEKKLVRTQKSFNILGMEVETPIYRPYKWKDLVDFLTQKYKISNRQAYADIELAKRFFLIGRTKYDKDFARGFRIEQGEELMYQSMEEGNQTAAAMFYKTIIQLEGLDKIEQEKLDPSFYQPMQPVIVSDPSELNFPKLDKPDQVVERLMKSFKKGAIDKMLDSAEDVEEEDEGG